jgi:hypothetical protein
MAFSKAHAQGFALAAILQDDRDLGWANAHVEDHLLQSATAHIRAVRDAVDKREALARLVREVHGEHDATVLPAHFAVRLNERAKHESLPGGDEVLGILSRVARREALP